MARWALVAREGGAPAQATGLGTTVVGSEIGYERATSASIAIAAAPQRSRRRPPAATARERGPEVPDDRDPAGVRQLAGHDRDCVVHVYESRGDGVERAGERSPVRWQARDLPAEHRPTHALVADVPGVREGRDWPGVDRGACRSEQRSRGPARDEDMRLEALVQRADEQCEALRRSARLGPVMDVEDAGRHRRRVAWERRGHARRSARLA
jgi:hypothetical protein